MLRLALVASVATFMLAFAGPALAVNFTSSQIASPTDGSVITQDGDNPTTLHVAGTTSGGDSNADLVCYYGTSRRVVAANVTVTTGAFSADVPLAGVLAGSPNPYCLIRAVPTGDTTVYRPTGPNNNFAGPRVRFGEVQTFKVGGTGPNQNAVKDYLVGQAQTRGYMDFLSFGDYGFDYSFVFDPITLNQSSSLFYGNGWARTLNGCTVASSTCAVATQSEITVDGKNAYPPAAADHVYAIDATHQSRLLSGFPELAYTQNIDPLTGNAHITEADPIVKCSPNETAFHLASNDPAWSTDCSSFAPSGVKLDRTMDTDQEGRRTKIVDVWTNTDSVSHDLEVQYEEEFSGDATYSGSPSFAYSWMDPSSFSAPGVDQTIQGPGGSGPATVFVDGNGDSDDTFQFPQGAATISPAPTSIHWYQKPNGLIYGTFRFAQTIPAGGTATVYRTYVDGGSKESIASRAAAEQDRLGSPQVAITGPADGSTTDNPAATVTGTASDPGGAVTSLKVNGDAVPVAADGSWSKAMTLTPGENTITAVAGDAAGNSSTASVKLTYTPKATPPPAADKTAPVIGLAIGKTKLAALISKGLPVTVSCSEACTFSVTLTLDSKTAKALHLSKVVTIAKASGSLAKAGKKKVVVKLTKKAKKALKKAAKVAITVKGTAKDKAGNRAAKSKKVTIKKK